MSSTAQPTQPTQPVSTSPEGEPVGGGNPPPIDTSPPPPEAAPAALPPPPPPEPKPKPDRSHDNEFGPAVLHVLNIEGRTLTRTEIETLFGDDPHGAVHVVMLASEAGFWKEDRDSVINYLKTDDNELFAKEIKRRKQINTAAKERRELDKKLEAAQTEIKERLTEWKKLSPQPIQPGQEAEVEMYLMLEHRDDVESIRNKHYRYNPDDESYVLLDGNGNGTGTTIYVRNSVGPILGGLERLGEDQNQPQRAVKAKRLFGALVDYLPGAEEIKAKERDVFDANGFVYKEDGVIKKETIQKIQEFLLKECENIVSDPEYASFDKQSFTVITLAKYFPADQPYTRPVVEGALRILETRLKLDPTKNKEKLIELRKLYGAVFSLPREPIIELSAFVNLFAPELPNISAQFWKDAVINRLQVEQIVNAIGTPENLPGIGRVLKEFIPAPDKIVDEMVKLDQYQARPNKLDKGTMIKRVDELLLFHKNRNWGDKAMIGISMLALLLQLFQQWDKESTATASQQGEGG